MLLMTTCFLNTTAEAHTQDCINGVVCWHGNLNYPFWDSGNSGGSFWEVGSAYLSENSKEQIQITILSYWTSYESTANTRNGFHTAKLYPPTLMFLSEDKQSGQLYFSSDKKNWHEINKDRSEYRIYFNNAYYLVKHHLGLA